MLIAPIFLINYKYVHKVCSGDVLCYVGDLKYVARNPWNEYAVGNMTCLDVTELDLVVPAIGFRTHFYDLRLDLHYFLFVWYFSLAFVNRGYISVIFF